MRLVVRTGGETFAVEVEEDPEVAGRYRVRLDAEWLEVDASPAPSGSASLLIDGASWAVDEVREENGEIVVTLGAESVRLQVEEPGRRRGGAGRGASGGAGQRLVAPMPGRVVAVHVAAGDRVDRGRALVVLEAMKMENEFRATTGGTVTQVAVVAGQAVNAGDLLVVVTAEDG